MSHTETSDWQFVFEKDLRTQALVSLLKTAHLALFDMLGYRYALSAGGMFLGYDVLGKFFRGNQTSSKKDALKSAVAHFGPYANLVRPMRPSEDMIQDTIADQLVYICEEPDRWGLIVLLRTGDAWARGFCPNTRFARSCCEIREISGTKRKHAQSEKMPL